MRVNVEMSDIYVDISDICVFSVFVKSIIGFLVTEMNLDFGRNY